MGTSSSSISRHQEGFQVDPNKAPQYFHTVERGNASEPITGTSSDRIDKAMSEVKVSVRDAGDLQAKLQNEYFTEWRENCEVQEFHGYALGQIDTLLHKISDKFTINDINIYNKMSGIHFSQEVEVKIYEFTFGEQLSSGTIHFGMVAISKSNDSVDAVTCLYTLGFAIARVFVQKKRKKRILGINAGTDRRSWYETKSLGFVTQRALTNYCRVKALTEFKNRNLVSHINDVNSLDNI